MSNQVKLPYDPMWTALSWAKKHCPSYITNTMDTDQQIVYYFCEEKEALLFQLKWTP